MAAFSAPNTSAVMGSVDRSQLDAFARGHSAAMLTGAGLASLARGAHRLSVNS
jgi:hypothetical protein